MTQPQKKMAPGDNVIYDPAHGQGFGENAIGAPITAEMSELDLKPGTTVLYLEDDADSAWPLIEWVDGKGLDRITTVEPNAFLNDFHL